MIIKFFVGRNFRQAFKFSTTTVKQAEVELFIDGKPVKIEAGSALIQACEKAGATIPRFCYHERLNVAGNCRMCLVEVEKSPKPIASCAFPVSAGMKVFTNTPLVHKAREGIMEFLLSNHPLDCPICDQGGECDLQDQSIRYGSDRGRFKEYEGKRAVEDKDFGPLVKTTMTRCIHCTRCVRFANDIAGAEELGTSGRGNDMQIGMYIEKALNSELSGNVIDLCPVGALTSKPYEYKSRPWELKKTESIDVLDAVGSNIRVDSRGVEVLRILPRLNEEINMEWINDKTRFAFDGLKRQRLMTPMMKNEQGSFTELSWPKALQVISEKINSSGDGKYVSAIAGQFTDVETMVVVKDFLAKLGSYNYFLDGEKSKFIYQTADLRSNYILNSKLVGPESADVALLIGTNPRHEAAIYNVRFRQSYLNYTLDIGLIGEHVPLNYDYEYLGPDVEALKQIVSGKHKYFQKLSAAKRPMIVVGSGAIESEQGSDIYDLLYKLTQKVPALITKDWNGINFLQKNASHVGALDVGFVPGPSSIPLEKSKIVFLLGADDISKEQLPSDAFIVYVGHTGDVGANLADIVLPSSAYTEKNVTYVNAEGRTQMTKAAIASPGAAREDWKIVRALSEVTGVTLPYNSLAEVRDRLKEISPSLARYGILEPSTFSKLGLQLLSSIHTPTKHKSAFKLPVKDFYQADCISRNSETMAKCSETFTNELLEERKKRELNSTM